MDYLEINRRAYDKAAQEFEEKKDQHRIADEKIVAKFSSHLNEGMNILDIGPGSGQIANLLSEAGFKVTAIEFSELMARVVKRSAPKIDLIVDDFLRYDFGKVKFDGILAMAFIHLFPENDRLAVLRKIAGLLNEGGYLLVATTKHNKSEEGLFGKDNFKDSPLRFRKKFTKEELEKELSSVSFEIIEYYENVGVGNKEKIWMNFLVQKNS